MAGWHCQDSVTILIARRKSRYLLVEASREVDLGSKEGQRSLAEGIAKVIGEFGYMNSGPKVMRQINDRVFVMRTSRGGEGHIILALSFIKQLNGRELGFCTIRSSGSVRKLEELAGKIYKIA